MSPHSATSWGLSVQILGPVGDISHPNHSMFLLASLSAPCFAIMNGIHCRTVGVCCSSSAQMSLPLFLSVGMIKPQLPQADQEEAEIASDVVVDDEQLDPGSDGDM